MLDLRLSRALDHIARAEHVHFDCAQCKVRDRVFEVLFHQRHMLATEGRTAA